MAISEKSSNALIHGKSHLAEYGAWRNMKRRCLSHACPTFKNYGGRGIKICKEWEESFPAFLAYVGSRPSPKHSIDRINNDGHYEPGNVRWTTIDMQLSNRRPNKPSSKKPSKKETRPKLKLGRPPTNRTPVLVRLDKQPLAALDAWRKPLKISRPEAIRRKVDAVDFIAATLAMREPNAGTWGEIKARLGL